MSGERQARKRSVVPRLGEIRHHGSNQGRHGSGTQAAPVEKSAKQLVGCAGFYGHAQADFGKEQLGKARGVSLRSSAHALVHTSVHASAHAAHKKGQGIGMVEPPGK
jgi:hypothetical protein